MTPLEYFLLVLVFTINGIGLGWGLACLYFQKKLMDAMRPRPDEPREPWEKSPDWWKG